MSVSTISHTVRPLSLSDALSGHDGGWLDALSFGPLLIELAHMRFTDTLHTLRARYLPKRPAIGKCSHALSLFSATAAADPSNSWCALRQARLKSCDIALRALSHRLCFVLSSCGCWFSALATKREGEWEREGARRVGWNQRHKQQQQREQAQAIAETVIATTGLCVFAASRLAAPRLAVARDSVKSVYENCEKFVKQIKITVKTRKRRYVNKWGQSIQKRVTNYGTRFINSEAAAKGKKKCWAKKDEKERKSKTKSKQKNQNHAEVSVLIAGKESTKNA